MTKDHRIEVYIDAVMYLALLRRSEQADRTMSQHLRHLIRADLESSVAEMLAEKKRNGDRRGLAEPTRLCRMSASGRHERVWRIRGAQG